MAEKKHKPVRVILITDGDAAAQQVIMRAAAALQLRCLSATGGNPTPLDGPEIIRQLEEVPFDPVLIMFDDKGNRDKGAGEAALEYVARHPGVQVLGAIAVASGTPGTNGVDVDACINRQGCLLYDEVDKEGIACQTGLPRIHGDTVDVLAGLSLPCIIGIGDIGKMQYADAPALGSPITRQAIIEILQRNGIYSHEQAPH